MTVVPGSGFQPGFTYNSSDINAQQMAVGDFNGDGKLDLVTANFYDGGGIDIFLGNGDGSFQAPLNYMAGGQPYCVTVGDFNGDGKSDLAVSNYADGTISILLGNGDGTFQAPANYSTGSSPVSICVADFNGDGKADLAVANLGGTLSVLLGRGDGTFQPPANYSTNGAPRFVTAGDFNGDGKVDLAVANVHDVSVLLGNGDGTFQASSNYAAGQYPIALAVGDFNGDGRADLAVAGYSSGNNVSILLGNGNGTLQPPVSYFSGATAASIALTDFNGDGKLDIVIANFSDEGTSNVSVLMGNGDGTFQTAKVYAPGGLTRALLLADFNGDGRVDLATAGDSNVSVYLGKLLPLTTTTLTSTPNPSSSGQSVTLTAAVSPSGSGTIMFYDGGAMLGAVPLSSGQAVLSTRSLAVGSHSLSAASSGNSNYAATASTTLMHTVAGALLLTTCTLTSSQDPSNYGQSVTLTAAVSPASGSGSVTFYDGTLLLGTRPVTNGQAVLSANLPSSGVCLLKAHYGGDANLAPSLSAALFHTVNPLPANGFRAPANYPVGANPQAIAVGDFNGNGKVDLAVANDNGTVNILLERAMAPSRYLPPTASAATPRRL